MHKSPPQRITKEMLTALRGVTPRERVLHRLHGVTLVFGGLSSSAVGALLGDSARAVAYWVKRFKQDGIKGLEEETRPGRPSKLNASQLKAMQTFVKRAEAQSKSVNAKTLCAFLQTKYRISLTTRQCWRILKRLKT
jgi:transposase